MPKCPTCDKELNTEHGVKQHHVRVHDESLVDNTQVCDYCGEEFEHKEERRFCGQSCYFEWRDENMDTIAESISEGQDGGKVTFTCDYCGEEGEAYKSRYERNERNFCDRECSLKFNEEERSDLPTQENKKKAECASCGSELEVTKYKWENQDRFFCDRECVAEWRKVERFDVPCDTCGSTLRLTESEMGSSDLRFCDRECKYGYEGNKTTVNCSHCGAEKKIRKSRKKWVETGNYFCDRKCHTEYYNENGWPKEKERIEVECHACGRELKLTEVEEEKHERHFCDMDCVAEWRTTLAREKHPSWNRVEVECWWCGNNLLRKPSRVDRYTRQFCDSKCHGDWKSWNDVHPHDPDPNMGGKAYVEKEELRKKEEAKTKTLKELRGEF